MSYFDFAIDFRPTRCSSVNMMAGLRGLLPGGRGNSPCVMDQWSLTRLTVAEVVWSPNAERKTSSRTCAGGMGGCAGGIGVCGCGGFGDAAWRDSCSVSAATCFCKSAMLVASVPMSPCDARSFLILALALTRLTWFDAGRHR